MNRYQAGWAAVAGREKLRVLLGAMCAAVACGCMTPIPYTPDENLVQTLGPEKAKEELQIVLSRAIEPQIGMAELTEDSLHYRWIQTHLGAFYQSVTNAIDTQIFFANLSRVEIYENHNVFLYGPNDSRVDKVRFATAEDARRFADLLLSFKARWKAAHPGVG